MDSHAIQSILSRSANDNFIVHVMTLDMNSLRNLTHSDERGLDANVNAQSSLLFDVLQKEMDLNRRDRRIILCNILLYQQNIFLLRQHGITVKDRDGTYELSW